MENISELEKVMVQYGSFPIAMAIFGSVLITARAPVEAWLLTLCEIMKGELDKKSPLEYPVLTGYENFRGQIEQIRSTYRQNLSTVLARV